ILLVRSLQLLKLALSVFQFLGQAASDRRFQISDDMFWKDDRPFRIIGGDVHYFRVLPQVERWWAILLPTIAPLLYQNGGPIIMVQVYEAWNFILLKSWLVANKCCQVENEFGSYGDDKAYLHHLVTLARKHLGHDIVLYVILLLDYFISYNIKVRRTGPYRCTEIWLVWYVNFTRYLFVTVDSDHYIPCNGLYRLVPGGPRTGMTEEDIVCNMFITAAA
ncbi:hypothetical protein GW17_00027195, partial [Ensete ventricosum]